MTNQSSMLIPELVTDFVLRCCVLKKVTLGRVMREKLLSSYNRTLQL